MPIWLEQGPIAVNNSLMSDKTDPKLPVTSIQPEKPAEVGGPKGPEPTRYGDWEQKGRCTDF